MQTVDFRGIVETAAVGIVLLDPSSRTVEEVNDRFAFLVGERRDALRGLRFEAIGAGSDPVAQATVRERVEAAVAEDPQQFDWLIEREDGDQRWGEVIISRTGDGGREMLVAFVWDITARKQDERGMEETNQRLDRFASVVAHDLQNPLHLAQGYLEVAQADCDSDDLDTVSDALSRMELLIDDLLSWARAHGPVGELEVVSLREVLAGAWRGLDPSSATLQVETDMVIYADSGRLRQLVENLLQNSVEHGGEGVTVTVRALPDGFVLEDDGPGIPESDRAAVFELGHSAAADGTGIGLAIVQQMVTAHDWAIHVSESSSGGARFELTGIDIAA